jgi:asparagine synthase (glutamine-hydrolysing)
MCGICGVIGEQSREVGEAIVRRMMSAIVHRGPDEAGFLCAPPVAFGIRRLSIIDLPGGSQPIRNESQTLAVVFNGEIYNFRELRRELESLGHRFRTVSDTEVIVHAFEAWGESCVGRLHGMFAFAIVELPQGPGGRASRAFMARDRLGIKPLYYASANGALLFASEIRALLASGRLSTQLSPSALPSYLLFGSVCEPDTLIDGVASLPPGHSLTISADTPLPLPNPRPYWSAPRVSPAMAKSGHASNVTASAAASQVRSLLETAVGRHLVADVPVGIFLSSGLDSTAIAALASNKQKGIHTFTVAFPDEDYSEAEMARRTAQRLDTQHTELALSDQEMLARLDEAVAAFDQPSMDGINTYFVSWAARQAGLKVALSGLGSDELFGGYTSFRSAMPLARLARAARFVPKSLRGFAGSALEKSRAYPGSPAKFHKAASAWLDPALLPHPYFFSRTLFTPQMVARAMPARSLSWQSTSWWKSLLASATEAASMDSFTGISWLELRSYLPNTLLRDTDAMSMRHSLEVRVPFLDAPLVDYLLELPQSAKSGSRRPKALLVNALGHLLPPEVVSQRKRTFTFPWENWLRGTLGARVARGLSEWSLSPLLSAEFALGVWQDFLRGHTTWSRPWSLYVLNEWGKRNLRAAGSSPRLQQTTAAVSVA